VRKPKANKSLVSALSKFRTKVKLYTRNTEKQLEMTNPMFSFPNPNQATQISTILRLNAYFNNSQKLINVPLNGKNYIPWAKAARVTLQGKGLFGYVNGSRIRPSE
jgi:gag-polypeptide of LTR copia-type